MTEGREASCWLCGDDHTEERHRAITEQGVAEWRAGRDTTRCWDSHGGTVHGPHLCAEGRKATPERCPSCKRVVPVAWRDDFFSARTNCGYCGIYLTRKERGNA